MKDTRDIIHERFMSSLAAEGLTLDSQLSIKQIAAFSGLSDRTIRRYLSEGAFLVELVEGKRGKENRIQAQNAYDVIKGKDVGQPVSAKPTGSEPMILEALATLTATIEAQSRTIDSLKAELHDTRGQLHQMNEAMVKALPARSEELRPRFWARWFRKG